MQLNTPYYAVEQTHKRTGTVYLVTTREGTPFLTKANAKRKLNKYDSTAYYYDERVVEVQLVVTGEIS